MARQSNGESPSQARGIHEHQLGVAGEQLSDALVVP